MANRGDRGDRVERGDRVRERERERAMERDETRARRETARDPPRERRVPLNEYFVDGEGIHREVMQTEICKYLGAEATSRPTEYNGRRGYLVKALRPFTPEMLDDLKTLSESYVSENRTNIARGYEALPYEDSDARRRGDGMSSFGREPRDPRDMRYPSPASTYPSDQSNYNMQSGYPPGGVYPPSSYPTGSGYTTAPVYSTGVNPATGYPAYTYEQEYPPQGGYATYAPPPMYTGRGQPRDPALPAGYVYGTSAPEIPGRRAQVDDGYGQYYETQAGPSPAARGGFAAPYRGNQTAYDIPRTQDYGPRDQPPVRDPHRRRQ